MEHRANKAQLVSYKVSEIVTKKMQPHTIAAEVILPDCKEIVKCMLAENARKEISLVTLSNDTTRISRRIDNISSDIQEHPCTYVKS